MNNETNLYAGSIPLVVNIKIYIYINIRLMINISVRLRSVKKYVCLQKINIEILSVEI